MTDSLHGSAAPGREGAHPRLHKVPKQRQSGRFDLAATRSTVDLDRVLVLQEQRQLSATELRVLLGLLEREAGLSELATTLDQRPEEVWRAASRLARRGLVRWHHPGSLAQTRLEITADGLTTMQPLLTATAGQAAAPPTARVVTIG